MDQRQCQIEESENENVFDMEEMAPCPDTYDLPAIKVNTTQHDEMEVAVTDPQEDLNDLAEISVENEEDIDIIENVAVNQYQSEQHIDNHEPGTELNKEKDESQNHASLGDDREVECEPEQQQNEVHPTNPAVR